MDLNERYIEQTSASDRYEAARKALEKLEWWPLDGDRPFTAVLNGDDVRMIHAALRALVAPPNVGESEEQIVGRVLRATPPPMIDSDGHYCFTLTALASLGSALIRAGIQSAHESWECEDRPTQEQMLRWLGIDCKESTDNEGEPSIYIYAQHIEREED